MSEHVIYLLAISLPALGILAGHWFPWRKVIGKELTRVQAYSYGVFWIVLVPCVVMLAQGEIGHVLLLLTSVAAAGLATIGAYAVDIWTETRHRLLDERDRANYAAVRDTKPADLAD